MFIGLWGRKDIKMDGFISVGVCRSIEERYLFEVEEERV